MITRFSSNPIFELATGAHILFFLYLLKLHIVVMPPQEILSFLLEYVYTICLVDLDLLLECY